MADSEKIAGQIIECFKRGGKLMVCGNGGSAAESQHFAAELIGKLSTNRRPLPALSLTTDTSILTAISNDFGFKWVFARQVMALGAPGDLLISLSTSGKSENVLLAIDEAKKAGLEVIDFPRKGDSTAHIQENQLKLIHDVCRIVEDHFIEKDSASRV